MIIKKYRKMDTDKAVKNFRTLLKHMEQRPAMYVKGGEYHLLTTFLDGYLLCFHQITGGNLAQCFREWVQGKYKKHFAIHEAAYILHYVAMDDSELAAKKLFELWNEFLDWYNPTQ
jgi:hypothetical protein